jgi:hypothetical protein
MRHLHDVRDFRFRRRRGAPDLRRFHRPAQKDDELERISLRADEEVADRAREHDAAVRRVDALIPEIGGRLAQPLVGVLQIFRQVARERRLRRRPAIVRLAFLNPLLAVITLVPAHACHFIDGGPARCGLAVSSDASSYGL